MSLLKVSNTGIEISSDRYLTDNATGLFFLLNVIYLFKEKYISFDSSILFSDVSLNIFLGVIVFMLTTAMGLILSCFAFVILEFPYIGLEYIWWKLKWPLCPIQFKRVFSKMINGLEYKKWHRNLIVFEERLMKRKVNIDRFLIQRGIRILLRNLSFILLLDSGLFFLKGICMWHWTVIIAILFLIMSSYIGFFANAGLLLTYRMNFPNSSLVEIYPLSVREDVEISTSESQI